MNNQQLGAYLLDVVGGDPVQLEVASISALHSRMPSWPRYGSVPRSKRAYLDQISTPGWACYVKRRKGVHRGRRTTWISLSPRGRKALSAHVAALREVIRGVD